MIRHILTAGDKDYTASQDQTFDKFSTALPTSALLLYVDATITSGTTPTAYSAEHPATLIDELELFINGKSRGTIKGIDAWNMMRHDRGVEPQYTRTTYADSTALANDVVLRLDFLNKIPPGIPISLRVKAGSIADQVDSAGATAWTSCKIYARQEVLVHNPGIEHEMKALRDIMQSVACDAFSASVFTLSGTPTADWDVKECQFTDLIEQLFLRVRNNSALSNALITDYALRHRQQNVREWKAEDLASHWTRECSLAKPTGIYCIDLDPERDRDGHVSVKQGEQFGIGVKHSTVTGTGDLRIVARKTQALYL